MIKVEGLSLQYGTQDILNNISFSIQKGTIVGLLGPNGAGKSSIIKVLAGLVFPKEGRLFLNDQSLKTFAELRKHCGYLIDSPAFYPYLSAKQNLTLIKKIGRSDRDIETLLTQVGLEDTGTKKVKHFSTGMKQRLAIAVALLRSPEILILDEPFNGLDPNGFQDLINLLKELNAKGTTILVSSHLLNELEQFADAFILLHEGQIALDITKPVLQASRKKVTFTFDSEPDDDVKTFITVRSGKMTKNKEAVLLLDPGEIAETVNTLVEMESTPVNIETHTILQEKYFEIAG